MAERAEGTAEKLSQGTIGARRLLQGVSLIGFLVAITPLSADSVSIFGISLSITEELLTGILTVVLIYLTIGFVVRAFTDLAGAGESRFESRLRERIAGQMDDIKNQTVDRLAKVVPLSRPGEKFHSQSFESLLNDAVPKSPEYRAAMMNNIVGEIYERKSQERRQGDSEESLTKEALTQEFEPVVLELLASHEERCRWRFRVNAPRWMLQRALISVRYAFFDAVAPSLMALLVIALLLGWIDTGWFLESLRGLGG